MLIWANFKIKKVYAKVDEDNTNKKVLSFGAKFAIITLEEQGWEHENEFSICSKSFSNEEDLKKILIKLEVPENGISEIMLSNKQTNN